MSRWGRGRSGAVAVPLDSALFRENSNCPSAARSAGTVGKWGITSFTSIRNAPYAYTNLAKKPVQDQNSPLTVPALETEQPPPKPKKFFKSRNAEPFPPVPQITYAPPAHPVPLSPEHSTTTKEKKSHKRNRAYDRDSSSPELPRRNSEKTKARKNSVATKAAKKEQPPIQDSQPPNKRYLVRTRNKVINYAEDGSNSPIPDFTARYEPSSPRVASPSKLPSPPKVQSPKTSPSISSPGPAKICIASPSTSKEANEERKPPPIVLRISKGTSRIVSTDSNEGFTSPGSDRHSSMDLHSDVGSEHKKSPLMETICSPKHEGLKITIKCAGLNQEHKKDKKKDRKEGHKSHKRHHKTVNEESVKVSSSPLPDSDTYELYKTLSSPAHDAEKGIKHPNPDEIETQLAKLDSVDLEPTTLLTPSVETKPVESISGRSRRNLTKPDPVKVISVETMESLQEMESSDCNSGRSRRNRRNINYNENDDYLDALTSRYTAKTVDLKKESKKGKKKIVEESTDTTNVLEGAENIDNNDLLSILSGSGDKEQCEDNTQNVKHLRKYKYVHNKQPNMKDVDKKYSHTTDDSEDSHDDETLANIISTSVEKNQCETNTKKIKHIKKQKYLHNKHENVEDVADYDLSKDDREEKHLSSAVDSDDSHENDTLATLLLVSGENNTKKVKNLKKHKYLHNKNENVEEVGKNIQGKYTKKQKLVSPSDDLENPHKNDTLSKYVKKGKHKKQKLKYSGSADDSEDLQDDEALAAFINKTKHKPLRQDEVPQSLPCDSKHEQKSSKEVFNAPDDNRHDNLEEVRYNSGDENRDDPEEHKHNRRNMQNKYEDIKSVSDSMDHREKYVKDMGNSSSEKSTCDQDSQGELKETLVENNNILNSEDSYEVQNDDNRLTNLQPENYAYNNNPNENSEEDTQKSNQEDAFKFPNEVSDIEDQAEGKPSVKLVITKKKGSIFKSKSLVNDNPSPLPARKRRHLYKHQWANDKGNETPRPEPQETVVNNPAKVLPEKLTRVTKYRSPDPMADDDEAAKPYSSIRCAKEVKEYYTVVRNVKKAHQIQEIGEFQEFNDDVEYLLDALQDNNPNSTRCLSAITLATKCMAPAFRMHLRAHGTVQKFFSSLHDATKDQSLGLCTATVMFVLSQDRLNMDLDRESLELMLNLLESDASHKNALDDCGLTSAQLTKTQERVRELCAEIKSQGKATHLDLDNITVGHLAMETLLSLTSKRAGEWFKEELRVLGGVDHIVRTIQDCANRLESPAASWTPADVDVLRKIDRCMRVLENVTQQNEDNQLYLVGESLGAARTFAWLFCRCTGEARLYPHLREPLLETALPALKVLVNLSHAFGSTASIGAQAVGEQPSVMEVCLVILNNQGSFISDKKNFEFSVCVLLLLINLVQNNEVNTQRLLNVRIQVDSEEDIISRTVSALDLIVELFYKREELARRAEENTDALLDGEKDADSDNDKKKQPDDIDETVAKLLSRAGTHMEHTMVCAYIALLLGHMAIVSTTHAATVRARVPSYAPLLPTLNKYYTFLSLTASAEAAIVAHVKATHRIIKFMEECDKLDTETPMQPSASYSATTPYSSTTSYYQTSPSDMPQDMSLSNLNYMNCSTSSSDRMSSSMEIDGYH